MLPIKKYTDEFDFLKQGNNSDVDLGNYIAPTDTVLTWQFEQYQGDAITTYEARKGYRFGDEFVVTETIDLISALTIESEISTTDTSYYRQNANDLLESNLEKGYYYLYISDGTNEHKSEIFAVLEGLIDYDGYEISDLVSNDTEIETTSAGYETITLSSTVTVSRIDTEYNSKPISGSLTFSWDYDFTNYYDDVNESSNNTTESFIIPSGSDSITFTANKTVTFPYSFLAFEVGTYDSSCTSVDTTLTSTYMIYNSFVLSFDVEALDELTLPLRSGYDYDFKIEWGDGEESTITAYDAADISHTYTDAGTYEWTIKGVCEAIYFNNSGTTKDKLTEIVKWGNVKATTMQAAYYGCSNLTTLASDFDSSVNITNMFQAFSGCSSLNSSIDWDTSSVTTFGFMFNGCSSLNSAITLSTSLATNMASMFNGCTIFNQALSFDTPIVTNMGSMFLNCAALDSDITFNSLLVTDMSNMFNGCSVFNSTLSLVTSSVIDMSYMFKSCSLFNSDITSFETSLVEDISFMFQSCFVFDQAIGVWDVSSVTNMDNTFLFCSVFNQDLSSWDVSNVTNMSSLFQRCSLFNQDLSLWDVSSVTLMTRMFQYCTVFDQDLSTWDVSNVTDMSNMFLYAFAYSTANYDLLLNAWSLLTLQSSVTFTMNSTTTYTITTSQAAREIITGTYLWTITDGGGI